MTTTGLNVYILKMKDQVIEHFLSLVKKATKKKIVALRIDDSGEFTSTQS